MPLIFQAQIQHGDAQHGDAQHGNAQHGDAQHGDAQTHVLFEIQNLQKDKKQGENLYYMCCLLEENGPPLGLLLNYSLAAEDFDLISVENQG